MNNEYVTLWEDYELPSKGLIYDKEVDPNITLRSMTTAEEMKRLNATNAPYKVMCDIIEDCMKTKPAIHVRDMCIGDYQYLLHKLRIVSYGNKYKITVFCPKCGKPQDLEVDLDELKVNSWNEEVAKYQNIILPVTNHEIELKFETPKDLDNIAFRAREAAKDKKNVGMDFTFLYTLLAVIKRVDGQILHDETLLDLLKSLPIRDANYILNKSAQLIEKVGIDNNITVTCNDPKCGHEFIVPFRPGRDFFGSSDDE